MDAKVVEVIIDRDLPKDRPYKAESTLRGGLVLRVRPEFAGAVPNALVDVARANTLGQVERAYRFSKPTDPRKIEDHIPLPKVDPFLGGGLTYGSERPKSIRDEITKWDNEARKTLPGAITIYRQPSGRHLFRTGEGEFLERFTFEDMVDAVVLAARSSRVDTPLTILVDGFTPVERANFFATLDLHVTESGRRDRLSLMVIPVEKGRIRFEDALLEADTPVAQYGIGGGGKKPPQGPPRGGWGKPPDKDPPGGWHSGQFSGPKGTQFRVDLHVNPGRDAQRGWFTKVWDWLCTTVNKFFQSGGKPSDLQKYIRDELRKHRATFEADGIDIRSIQIEIQGVDLYISFEGNNAIRTLDVG